MHTNPRKMELLLLCSQLCPGIWTGVCHPAGATKNVLGKQVRHMSQTWSFPGRRNEPFIFLCGHPSSLSLDFSLCSEPPPLSLTSIFLLNTPASFLILPDPGLLFGLGWSLFYGKYNHIIPLPLPILLSPFLPLGLMFPPVKHMPKIVQSLDFGSFWLLDYFYRLQQMNNSNVNIQNASNFDTFWVPTW